MSLPVKHLPISVLILGGRGAWGRKINDTLQRDFNECSRTPVGNVITLGSAERLTAGKLIKERLIDAVIVATPPGAHCSYALQCIDAKVPVFIEKPLTCTLWEAQHLIRYAASTPRSHILVDHVWCFASSWRFFASAVERKRAQTPIVKIAVTSGGPGPVRKDYSALWDYGAHDVALVLDLLGIATPWTVKAATRTEVCGRASDQHLICGERFTWAADFSGIEVLGRTSNAQTAKTRTCTVCFANGTALIHNGHDVDVADWREEPGEDIEISDVKTSGSYPNEKPLTNALGEFIACAVHHEGLGGSAGHLFGVSFPYEVTRVLDAIQRTL